MQCTVLSIFVRMKNVSPKYCWYSSRTAIVKNLHGKVTYSNFVNLILGEEGCKTFQVVNFRCFRGSSLLTTDILTCRVVGYSSVIVVLVITSGSHRTLCWRVRPDVCGTVSLEVAVRQQQLHGDCWCQGLLCIHDSGRSIRRPDRPLCQCPIGSVRLRRWPLVSAAFTCLRVPLSIPLCLLNHKQTSPQILWYVTQGWADQGMCHAKPEGNRPLGRHWGRV
jgi:hypothetical protein